MSCKTTRLLKKADQKMLDNQIINGKIFSDIFTGFALYDPESQAFLYQHEADKYYTPASNTKLYTLYTSMNILGDTLPLMHYYQKGDSLFFWGTGNPLFLHPDFEVGSEALDFLKKQSAKLFYIDSQYMDNRFGPGWSWGDYAYAYQVEKSPMPMYGNLVYFEKRNGGAIQYTPSLAAYWTQMDPVVRYAFRDEFQNQFQLPYKALTNEDFTDEAPFRTDPQTLVNLLIDTLKRQVEYLPRYMPIESETISIPMPDTLYRRFMRSSDNFIGEQLILMCSDKLYGMQSSRRAIDYALENLLNDLPDAPIWRDGSGLSRYNLFTPRTMVKLLEKLHQQMPEERLLSILPTGGKYGTIANWYGGNPPYVFAKTGTLSNKHCLSGFVRTNSGKLLIFSFMNNNYIGSSNPVKEQMQATLEWIRDNL